MGTSQSLALVLKYKDEEARCQPAQTLSELRIAANTAFPKHLGQNRGELKFVYEPLLFPIESEADLKVVYKVAEKNSLRELPIVVSKESARMRSPPASPGGTPAFPIAKIRHKDTGVVLGGGLLLPRISLCVTSRLLVASFQDLRKLEVKLRKTQIGVTHDQLLISSSLNVTCFSYVIESQEIDNLRDVNLDNCAELNPGDFCTAVQPGGSRYLRLEVISGNSEFLTVSSDESQHLGSLVYDLNWRFVGLLSDSKRIAVGPSLKKLIFRPVL